MANPDQPFDPKSAYSTGFIGARFDPRAFEVLCDSIIRAGGDPDGGRVAWEWGLEDAGKGKLTTTWLHVDNVFPGCWPGPPQVVGDCVSHGCANALLTSMSCEIASGHIDEETKRPEGPPELSAEAIKNVPISSESLYWWRGSSSDGWVCAEAAQVAINKGFLVRKPYPTLKLDLTNYSESNIRLFGARAPGDGIASEAVRHRARTATVLESREQVRDFLASGYGVFNCSNLGFSDERDENGYSRQSGSWAHSQCLIGYDDRAEIIQKYGEALVLWLNSWGPRWNSGGRKVYGTSLLIPEGAFWAKASTIDRCRVFALSSIAGWPRRKLPTYGAEGNI
jgi:hypothetical protein